MNKLDVLTKSFVSNNKRFAELFNVFVFNKNLIDPDDLYDQDSSQIQMEIEKSLLNEKQRDSIKLLKYMSNDKVNLLLLGIENQSMVNYAMPARVLQYDAITYNRQIKSIYNQAKQDKVKGFRYGHGIPKGQKLIPVITLVLYWGDNRWDGPRSMFEMLDEKDINNYKDYISDYRINIICPYEMSDEQLKKLQTDLFHVMSLIKYSKDKKKYFEIVEDDRFSAVPIETVELINTATNAKIQYNDKEEVVNVCKAIEDMKVELRAEGKIEGKIEGKLEGKAEGIIEGSVLTAMKLGKSKDEAISFACEEYGKSIEEVKAILMNL